MNKKSVFVICEYQRNKNTFKRGSLELLSASYKLREQGLKDFDTDYEICAVVADCGIDADFDILAKFGAQKVIYLKNEKFKNYDCKYLASALTKLIRAKNPDIVLFSATNCGRELAPSVTSRINTGLTADCTDLRLTTCKNEVKLAATRPTFGGVLMATILCKTNPQCATVREGVLPLKERNLEPYEVEEFTLGDNFCTPSLIKIVEFIPQLTRGIDLDGAKIIFAGGRGLKTKENFDKLRTLCKITGVSLGASRGAVDLGIAPQECQIGQTGKTVAPEIYVAFAISGAIHHISGMSASKTVVAINTDPEAPIFSHCDYKINADAVQIIEQMVEKLS